MPSVARYRCVNGDRYKQTQIEVAVSVSFDPYGKEDAGMPELVYFVII